MKSLLEALEEGRLLELPESGKEEALELLAHLIEAIPDIGTKTDLMKSVMERESQANTAIGRGVACPHCRTAAEGELLCAVGWSPQGIDYGAADGRKVHLVVMYYVPDSERNGYLKEISGLAKAISSGGDTIESISSLPDIHTVREKLLDWVGLALNEAIPDPKARMIKLEARQAIAALAAAAPPMMVASGARFLPFRLVTWQGGCIVLCNDPGLADTLEKDGELGSKIAHAREFDLPEYRIAVLSESIFAANRKEYMGVAIRME
ncbi:MAG TPA: PTS sugar transporter subunit IIA [Rectinemataceae bacterium]|nr:PTS sugar transporter subunit IIA [Rectinemataceae bacterium]